MSDSVYTPSALLSGEPALIQAFQSTWLQTRTESLHRAVLQEIITQSFRVATANGWPSNAFDVQSAVEALAHDLREAAGRFTVPSFIMGCCSENLDPDELLFALSAEFPHTRNIHIATSCQAVTSDMGFKPASPDGKMLGLLAVFDPMGSYVTLGLPPPQEHRDAAFFHAMDEGYLKLRERAWSTVKNPANTDIAPELLSDSLAIWMTALPGLEEAALESLYEWGRIRFNRCIPVVGGSPADAGIQGKWFCACLESPKGSRIFTNETEPGLVVTLVAAAVKVHPLFMHPYSATKCRAKVTSCGSSEDPVIGERQGRVIRGVRDSEGIDHSAGTLYRKWVEEHVQEGLFAEPDTAKSPHDFSPDVLRDSTLCPLGVQIAHEGDDAFDYRMLHPSGIYRFHEGESAYLKAFASVEQGSSEIVLMRARRRDLLSRVSKMKEQLVGQLERSSSSSRGGSVDDVLRGSVAGALMVYCAGCMMAVNAGADRHQQTQRLSATLSQVYGGRPFLAMHPFGEQGLIAARQRNYHGNLMFSALVFSQEPSIELGYDSSVSEAIMELIGPLISTGVGVPADAQLERLFADVLQHGHSTSKEDLRRVVAAGMISDTLLQQMTRCSARPVHFALRMATHYDRLMSRHPLQAKAFGAAAAWYEQFCAEVVDAAQLHQVVRAQFLIDETLELAVRMATNNQAKAFVASDAFQNVVEEIWRGRGSSRFSDERKGRSSSFIGEDPSARTRLFAAALWSPQCRHYANMLSYVGLMFLHAATSVYWSSDVWCWSAVLIWHVSYVLQILASLTDARATALSVVNVLETFALLMIVVVVIHMEDAPRDLDACAMLVHFGNLLSFCVINPAYGPLIITVQLMARDILRFIVVYIYFAVGFLCVFRALGRGDTVIDFGEESSASTFFVLVNIIWGEDILWTVDDLKDQQTCLYSLIFGADDRAALNQVGFILSVGAVLSCTVLLMNLLIAMMTSSFARVQDDADLEWKSSRAALVLAARNASVLPMPFSVVEDIARLGRKCVNHIQRRAQRKAGEISTQDHRAIPVALGQAAQQSVEHVLTRWDAQKVREQLCSQVTKDQLDRVFMQGESLAERVQLLHHLVREAADKRDAPPKASKYDLDCQMPVFSDVGDGNLRPCMKMALAVTR